MTYAKVRGTSDLFNDDVDNFLILENILHYFSSKFNFKEIRTPIFEYSQLFSKAVGEESDIVHKEFYNFLDKGGREIALRPEGTAGTIRAIVENKMLSSNQILKLFYIGPMFRYERPQSGRQRQFHQYGVECVGNFSIYDEVNVILLAIAIIDSCKINNYVLEINNIGTINSRKKWIDELKKYFNNYRNQLSEDSLNRLDKNPLRILDDKVDGKKDFVKKAPKLSQFLNSDEKKYFDKIQNILDLAGIKYKVNEFLVRGLDYYNGLVFEFISKSKQLLGQSTIIAGGRYNSLVKSTGGPDVPGIGFGLGIERMIIAAKDENSSIFNYDKKLDIILAPLSDEAINICVVLSQILRMSGFSCDFNSSTVDLKKHFKFQNQNPSNLIGIIGNAEMKNEEILIKNQINKQEVNVKLSQLVEYLKAKRENNEQ